LYNFTVRKTALIIPYDKITSFSQVFKNKKTVLVGGCFDLIHFGHLKFLEKAKEQGDFLIVALESDEFIKKHKKKLSIHNQRERAEVLSSLNMVDLVVLLPYFSINQEYFDMVKAIHPKIVAVTEGDPQLENKKKQAMEVGAEVREVITNLKNFSTRNIARVFNL